MADRRIEGIAWLRAVMSIFVVAWHFGGGGRSLIFAEDQLLDHRFTFSDFVNFHVLLLAVPIFMIVSNYLCAQANPDARAALRRAARVVVLLLFWPTLLMLFQGGYRGLKENLPVAAAEWPNYLLSGGGTIFYFFASLALTHGLTFLGNRLSLGANVSLLVASVIALALAPVLSIVYNLSLLSAFWSPINFLPYSFAGIVVLRRFDKDAARGRALTGAAALMGLGCAFAALEWRFYPSRVFGPSNYFSFPAYTRPSLVVISMAILILALRYRPSAPRPVAFMARYSLALYCLHMFLVDVVRPLASRAGGSLGELGQAWVLIAFTVVSSYVAAKALSLVWRDPLLF